MSHTVCDSRCALTEHSAPTTPAWLAVFSLAMGVFSLLTAEYLPASLLSPMATELGVSEALTGQAVTVTAVAALFAGLLVPGLTRNIDRRTVLLIFTALMIVSSLLVAWSSSLGILLLMRIVLGVALGGFWSMAAAIAMRLVPLDLLPRALSIIFSGVAVGTVVAVPLGSYMGGLFGWRSAFIASAALGGITLIVQWSSLPSLVPGKPAQLKTIIEVLRRRGIAMGMLACILVHSGHFALFTYIRPFLETTSGPGTNGIALILLGFGVANFIGTLLTGSLLARSVRATMVIMPMVIGVTALALVCLPATLPLQAALIALWGLAFGGIPVAWSNWVTRAVPDRAESAGGMVVASVQSAIAAGAAGGGLMFSVNGISGVFIAAGSVMLLAALVIGTKVQSNPASSQPRERASR